MKLQLHSHVIQQSNCNKIFNIIKTVDKENLSLVTDIINTNSENYLKFHQLKGEEQRKFKVDECF
jgi:hypothetical protein